MKIVSKYLNLFVVGFISVIAINSLPCHGYGRTITANGNIVEKNLSSTFRQPILEINSNGMADIKITQGSNYSLKLKGSKNIIDYCHLRLANGVLTISEKNKPSDINQIKNYDVVVYITQPYIEKITVNGTGDVDFTNTYDSSSLKIRINGTGDVSVPSLSLDNLDVSITGTGDLKCAGKAFETVFSVSGTGDIDANLSGLDYIKASISGTGNITLSGTTNFAKYAVSGTGDIFARKMKAKEVEASTNGTGDITCYASEYFKGNRSSLTTITCYGNPKSRSLQSSGYAFPEDGSSSYNNSNSYSKSKSVRNKEIATQAREQAREQAAQAREQAREQARQQAAQAREQARQAREQAAQAREQARQAREQAAQAREQARQAREQARIEREKNRAMENAVTEAIRKVREKGIKGKLSIDINSDKNEIIIYQGKKVVSKSYYSNGDIESSESSYNYDYDTKKNVRVIYHDDGGSTTVYYDNAGNQYIDHSKK